MFTRHRVVVGTVRNIPVDIKKHAELLVLRTEGFLTWISCVKNRIFVYFIKLISIFTVRGLYLSFWATFFGDPARTLGIIFIVFVLRNVREMMDTGESIEQTQQSEGTKPGDRDKSS